MKVFRHSWFRIFRQWRLLTRIWKHRQDATPFSFPLSCYWCALAFASSAPGPLVSMTMPTSRNQLGTYQLLWLFGCWNGGKLCSTLDFSCCPFVTGMGTWAEGQLWCCCRVAFHLAGQAFWSRAFIKFEADLLFRHVGSCLKRVPFGIRVIGQARNMIVGMGDVKIQNKLWMTTLTGWCLGLRRKYSEG